MNARIERAFQEWLENQRKRGPILGSEDQLRRSFAAGWNQAKTEFAVG